MQDYLLTTDVQPIIKDMVHLYSGALRMAWPRRLTKTIENTAGKHGFSKTEAYEAAAAVNRWPSAPRNSTMICSEAVKLAIRMDLFPNTGRGVLDPHDDYIPRIVGAEILDLATPFHDDATKAYFTILRGYVPQVALSGVEDDDPKKINHLSKLWRTEVMTWAHRIQPDGYLIDFLINDLLL